jgi:hypothetical protein
MLQTAAFATILALIVHVTTALSNDGLYTWTSAIFASTLGNIEAVVAVLAVYFNNYV